MPYRTGGRPRCRGAATAAAPIAAAHLPRHPTATRTRLLLPQQPRIWPPPQPHRPVHAGEWIEQTWTTIGHNQAWCWDAALMRRPLHDRQPRLFSPAAPQCSVDGCASFSTGCTCSACKLGYVANGSGGCTKASRPALWRMRWQPLGAAERLWVLQMAHSAALLTACCAVHGSRPHRRGVYGLPAGQLLLVGERRLAPALQLAWRSDGQAEPRLTSHHLCPAFPAAPAARPAIPWMRRPGHACRCAGWPLTAGTARGTVVPSSSDFTRCLACPPPSQCEGDQSPSVCKSYTANTCTCTACKPGTCIACTGKAQAQPVGS